MSEAHERLFVSRDNWVAHCGKRGHAVALPSLDALVSLGVLPVYEIESGQVALARDLAETACSVVVRPRRTTLFREFDEAPSNKTISLEPTPHLRIDVNVDPRELESGFGPAVRQLFVLAKATSDLGQTAARTIDYFSGTTVTSRVNALLERASAQLELVRQTNVDRATLFANSAYYMGSKRSLGGFLVESLDNTLGESAVILDLMCGSGAAAKALSARWPVIAADALQFCTMLARSLGAGYRLDDARQVVEHVSTSMRPNVEALAQQLAEFLSAEEGIFQRELNAETAEDYLRFLNTMALFPESTRMSGWDPTREVELRRVEIKKQPYCLFTAYFANVYFGIRQSVEIDSIRYAIDQLDSPPSRDLALAALVATCSFIGTGYAGQFAQPRTFKSTDVPTLIDKRLISPLQEFSVRILALASESEHSARPIPTINLSWRDAMDEAAARNVPPTVVYLDAPYTRDEYSRYYHVLETLVKYDYPSSSGKGRAPARSTSRYFSSPFFTKDTQRVTDELVAIIDESLRRGWICAWSYSDRGVADLTDVVRRVGETHDVDVTSFTAAHEYKAQGGRRARTATEYCIIFEPLR